MSRRAAFFDTLRSADWKFLVLSTGDLLPFDGLNSQGRLRAEALARSMALMDYDAVTLGEHDLEPGPEFVKTLVGWLGRPVLATNYALPDSQSARSRLVEVRDKRVGLVAFLDPDLAADKAPWLHVESFDAVGAEIDSLRGRCDVLVALAHLGDESKVGELHRLYPGIDLFLLGHEGTMPARLERIDGAAMMGGSMRGRHLTRVEISFAQDGAIRDYVGSFLPVVKGWGRRAWIDSVLNGYYERVKALTMTDAFEAEILGSLEEPAVEYVGSEACAGCHEAQSKSWAATPHARARESLVKAQSEHDTQCQSCHTTGFGYRTGFATPRSTPERWNVGCEACHGAGAAHVKNPQASYGATDEALCVRCHDAHNSPKFNYSTYLPRVHP